MKINANITIAVASVGGVAAAGDLPAPVRTAVAGDAAGPQPVTEGVHRRADWSSQRNSNRASDTVASSIEEEVDEGGTRRGNRTPTGNGAVQGTRAGGGRPASPS